MLQNLPLPIYENPMLLFLYFKLNYFPPEIWKSEHLVVRQVFGGRVDRDITTGNKFEVHTRSQSQWTKKWPRAIMGAY